MAKHFATAPRMRSGKPIKAIGDEVSIKMSCKRGPLVK